MQKVFTPNLCVCLHEQSQLFCTQIFCRKESSRSDDIVSLYYTMMELMVGSLPWRQMTDNETMIKAKTEFKPAHVSC
jgi:hypothetical protein